MCLTLVISKQREHERKTIEDILDLDDIQRYYEQQKRLRLHKVYCIDLDRIFDSMTEARAFLNNSGDIINCCIGNQLKAGGHFWAYAEDAERIQFIKDNYLRSENIYTNYTFDRKRVRCIETGVIYPDMTSAAKALDMYGPSHISTACKTGRKSGGYHWEYAYDESALVPKKNTRSKKVRCIETGEIFGSVHAASTYYNTQSTYISICCRQPEKTAVGYHWEYINADSFDEKYLSGINYHATKRAYPTRPIRCIETGQTFESIREAQRQLGLSYQSICRSCKDSSKVAGGYH